MKAQRAVVVTPVMGPVPSLDLGALAALLEQGWTVNQTCAGYNDAVLVVLDAPAGAQANASTAQDPDA